jgi:hypothetical protein
VKARKHVRNEGSRRFKSAPLHHPVLQFSDLWENRSKSARVRAICDCAWTRRAAPAALIGEHGKTYPGSILLGPRMFARTAHSPIEPKLLAAREAISREIRHSSRKALVISPEHRPR